MATVVQILIIFVLIVAVFSVFLNFSQRYASKWQACAQKYRLNFKQGKEQMGETTVNAFRLRGYYRSCTISIFSSPSMGKAETHITVSYPKGLADSIANMPQGLLGRIGKGLVKQAQSPTSARQPFFIMLPPTKGTLQEVKKEVNPIIREQLIQLIIVCSGRDRRVEITDAYIMCKQKGFTANPSELFPMIDEIVTTINGLETNFYDLVI